MKHGIMNKMNRKAFAELVKGDVFVWHESQNVYMKTDKNASEVNAIVLAIGAFHTNGQYAGDFVIFSPGTRVEIIDDAAVTGTC